MCECPPLKNWLMYATYIPLIGADTYKFAYGDETDGIHDIDEGFKTRLHAIDMSCLAHSSWMGLAIKMVSFSVYLALKSCIFGHYYIYPVTDLSLCHSLTTQKHSVSYC